MPKLTKGQISPPHPTLAAEAVHRALLARQNMPLPVDREAREQELLKRNELLWRAYLLQEEDAAYGRRAKRKARETGAKGGHTRWRKAT